MGNRSGEKGRVFKRRGDSKEGLYFCSTELLLVEKKLEVGSHG